MFGHAKGLGTIAMQRLIDGYYTVADEELFRLLALAHREEGVKLEPSALAAMPGLLRVLNDRDYLQRIGATPERLANATHLAWGTGGSMVPEEEFAAYVERGLGQPRELPER